MPDNSGTIRSVGIEGITFRVPADVNATFMFTNVENAMIAASGGQNMRQITKRVPAIESLTLLTNAAEREVLKALAESLDDLALQFVTAAGDTYHSTGTIEIENVETEQNRTTIQMLPRGDWTAFVA